MPSALLCAPVRRVSFRKQLHVGQQHLRQVQAVYAPEPHRSRRKVGLDAFNSAEDACGLWT